MIASAVFIVRTCLELVLYVVLLCGRDPQSRGASNSYSATSTQLKKNFGVPKGVSAETVETPLDPPLTPTNHTQGYVSRASRSRRKWEGEGEVSSSSPAHFRREIRLASINCYAGDVAK